jgi:hypothetical protein
MTTYILDIDLIGSVATETWTADSTEAACALASLAHPDARSITVAGVAVPAHVS